MQKSKLIQLLQTFERAEWRLFRKFLCSPYFNQREDVVRLFDYLRNCVVEFKMEPNKESAFKTVYRAETYNDHKLRVAMSNLFKLAEQFILCEAHRSQEEQHQLELAKNYRARGLEKLFSQALKRAEEEQHKSEVRDTSFFQKEYAIQQEIYNYRATNKRIDELNFEEIFEALDIHFLIQKLKQSCFALSHQQVYKTEYNYGLIIPLLSHIAENDLLQIKSIALYYHCYLALSASEKTHHFQSLKQLLFEVDQQFQHTEMRDLYLLAINFCLRQYNAGNPSYLPDLLEFYQEGLERKYLLTDQRISRFTYRNVVTLGLIQREYSWIEQFIHAYKEYLEPKYQESMFGLCLARLEYSKGNYDKALSLLQKADYQDLLLNLAAKTVQIKIYFALDELDLLEAHLHAMQAFIRRKKVMAYHRDNYLNMIRLVRKVLELQPFDKQGKEALKREIQEQKSLVEREWLLEILD